MQDGLEIVRALSEIFSQRYGVPSDILADTWDVATTCLAVENPQEILRDLAYIWQYEADLLSDVPAFDERTTSAIVLAGVTAMYWVTRFLEMLGQKCPLSQEVQGAVATFFHDTASDYFPASSSVQATSLRVCVNTKLEPVMGGMVVEHEGRFYALCGAQEVENTQHPNRVAATMYAARFLAFGGRSFPAIQRAGTVDVTALFDWQPLSEICLRCRRPVGPSTICYQCEQIEVPSITDPTARLQMRASARDTIAGFLKTRHGFAVATVNHIWQDAQQHQVVEQDALVRARNDTRALLWKLGLPASLERDLGPRELLACARLHLLASSGRPQLDTLERTCLQNIVVDNIEGARRVASRHDRLARLIGHPRLLVPFIEELAQQEELPRPVAQLIAARTGNPRSVDALGKYLDRPDVQSKRSALKALQWMAESSPRATGPLSEALHDPESTVRLTAVHALAVAAQHGRVPPAAVLLRVAGNDWNPLVRHAAEVSLAAAETPICPVCGESIAWSGLPHPCLSQKEVLEQLSAAYDVALLGGSHGTQVFALVGMIIVEMGASNLVEQPETVARILQEPVIAPTTRLHALNALSKIEGPKGITDILRLVGSGDIVISSLAINKLLSAGVLPEAYLDLFYWIQANAVTFVAQGNLPLAATMLPGEPEAVGAWAAEYPFLTAFFLQVARRCWYCGDGIAAKDVHACSASIEDQLQRLFHIEMLLSQPRFVGHSLARTVLIAEYNALAGRSLLPPHPLCPSLPPPSVELPEEVSMLLEDAPPQQRIKAIQAMAGTPSLLAQLAVAHILSRQVGDEVHQQAMVALEDMGLGRCLECSRFFPVKMGHQCMQSGGPGKATIPASWRDMTLDLAEALGRQSDKPIGVVFRLVIRSDADLNQEGTTFSRMHALLATGDALPPAAMIAQVGSQWYTITGPEDENVLVEEFADHITAYLAAQAFLRAGAARLDRGEMISFPDIAQGEVPVAE